MATGQLLTILLLDGYSRSGDQTGTLGLATERVLMTELLQVTSALTPDVLYQMDTFEVATIVLF